MHIPDNYLSPLTCAALGAAMAPVWTVSARKVQAELSPARIPSLGVGAAFVFLVMMLNIPLPGGTTGHAVGGTLLAVLLGPWAACVALSVALLIQALLFGDGGVLAFGANCFNMAFVVPFLGYFCYRFLKDRIGGGRGGLISLGVAAGLPLYCPYPLAVTLPAMVLPHLLVGGFVEVLFTVGVFGFLQRVAPGSVYEGGETRVRTAYGLLVALLCLSPAGLLAKGSAWGEWRAEEIKEVVTGGHRLGFVPAGMARGFSLQGLLPDYGVSGLPAWGGYLLSAAAGGALLLIIFKLLALPRRGSASW